VSQRGLIHFIKG